MWGVKDKKSWFTRFSISNEEKGWNYPFTISIHSLKATPVGLSIQWFAQPLILTSMLLRRESCSLQLGTINVDWAYNRCNLTKDFIEDGTRQPSLICKKCLKNTSDAMRKFWISYNQNEGRAVLESPLLVWITWERIYRSTGHFKRSGKTSLWLILSYVDWTLIQSNVLLGHLWQLYLSIFWKQKFEEAVSHPFLTYPLGVFQKH